jgi:hypothetical protein
MKRICLAAALLACTTVPFAQTSTPPPAPVNIPKYRCEPKPEFPGGIAMRTMESKRKQFNSDVENYRKCMLAYIEERTAMNEANQTLYKAAVADYNATMKALNEAMEAAR